MMKIVSQQTGGNYETAYISAKSYKKVFVTDKGDELKLTDIKFKNCDVW